MKNIFKILGVSAVALCAAFVLQSFSSEKKAETTDYVKNLLPVWEMQKMHTLEVLDAMPEDKFNYQPNDVSKTFASQMVHIGYDTDYFRKGMIEGNRIKYEEPDASAMSKAEIRKLVSDAFDNYIAAISKLSEEDLAVELPFGPEKKLKRSQSILFAADHITNHRAKANLYLRMNDIEPPNYKFI